MTNRIEVRAPYNIATAVGPAQQVNGLLMHIHVDDDNEFLDIDPASFHDDPKIKNILGVELFSDLVKDGDHPAQARSIFLPAIKTKDSSLSAEEFENDRPWTFSWIRNGTTKVLDFQPKLQLQLLMRCPLGWAKFNKDDETHTSLAQELPVTINFEFKDQNDLGDNQGNKDKCSLFQIDYFRLKKEQGGKCFALNDDFFNLTFTTADQPGVRERDDDDFFWPTTLLRFEQFSQGSLPRGKHYYGVRFCKLEGLKTAAEKRGLCFTYNCITSKDHNWRAGWGRTEESSSKLWPLGIAPLGYYRTQPEIEAVPTQQRLPDLILSQFSDDLDACRWALDVNWKYQPEADLQSFTPLGSWNRKFVAPYRDALRTVKGGSPGSVIPSFDEEPSNQEWRISYELIDHHPHDDFDEGSGLDPQDFELSLRGSCPIRLLKSIALQSSLIQFIDTTGRPVTRELLLSPPPENEDYPQHDPKTPPEERGPTIFFHVTDLVSPNPSDNVEKSKVGALDLYFAALPSAGDPVPEAKPTESITATFQGLGAATVETATGSGKYLPVESRWLPGLRADVSLQLNAFGPGDQDPTPFEFTREEEQRPSTIISPFAGSDRKRGRFLLVVHEAGRSSLNHLLTMRLERLEPDQPDGSNKPDIDLIIIDTEPFLVARVQARIDLPNISEIGNWTGDDPSGASWELNDLGQGFDLTLPPQGIGEEFLRTYEDDQDNTRPLSYRLSPPATFKLARTPFRQTFSEAPWNLRRLLGYPGQRQPGMGVFSLQFELMYGLRTTISSDPIDLNLTELSALVGRLPKPFEQSDRPPIHVEGIRPTGQKDSLDADGIFAAYGQSYRRSWDLIRTRLALLLPKTPAQKGPFLKLDQGVSYEFRGDREIASPFDRETWKEKLKGGVDWGFTSENILTETTNSGKSSSGLIINPSFTALGGNGYQKASFANDKSTLYTDTFLGRTFYYSIERIGRIGMLWNTAKHVIIYERSVVHSQQFKDNVAGSNPDDKPPRWLGRPVMRKIVEYVQLLQPERSYPEFGEAPKVRGFARASKFPDPIIYVDSKWGRDIPGGWVVPLYDLLADPDFYKRPNVFLKLTTSDKSQTDGASNTPTTDTGAEDPFLWGRVTNPENLYFYTSTGKQLIGGVEVSTTADTDSWQPVPSVDYPVMPIPSAPAATEADAAPIPPASDKAALPPDVETGYERFALRLDTGNIPINLLSDRLASTADAVIHTVTLCRRALEGEVIPNKAQQAASVAMRRGLEYRNVLQNEVGKVVATIAQKESQVKEILDKIDHLADPVTNTISELEKSYQAAASSIPAINNVTGLIPVLNSAAQHLRSDWERKFNGFSDTLNQEFKQTITRAKEGTSQRIADVTNLLSPLTAHVESARTALHELERREGDQAHDIEKELGAVQKRIDNAVQVLTKFKTDDFLSAVIDDASKQPNLVAYQQTILAGIAKAEDQFNLVRSELAAFDQSIWTSFHQKYVSFIEKALPKGNYPFTPGQIAPAIKALKDIYDEIDHGLLAALKDKCKASVADLMKLNQVRAAQLAQLKKFLDEAVKLPQGDTVAIENYLGSFKTGVTNLKNRILADYFDAASKAIAAEQAIQNELRYVLADFDKIRDNLNTQNQRVKDVIKQAVNNLGLQDADKIPAQLQQAVQGLTRSAAAPIAAALAPYERWAREVDVQSIKQQFNDAAQKLGSKTLRMLHAHGLPPIGDAINLNKDRLSYYFQEKRQGLENVFNQLEHAVDITPANVLVNRGNELLERGVKSLGIELPSRRIAEKFLPNEDLLKNFDLKRVLPDFAGISLESLLGNLKFPMGQSEAVKITHGIDPTTFRPWAQCNIEMPLSGEIELFNVASLAISVVNGYFTAHTRIAVDASGSPARQVNASIRANWKLTVGGQRVMSVNNSTLRLDDSGKIKFEMGAKDIELAEVLKFITDLLDKASAGSGKSGLSFQLIREGMIPVGARATLNLALPALQSGAFSVSNILLNTFFELAFKTVNGNPRFYLAVGAGLSSKERPFNLSVMCLGGGGWFVVKAMYLPPLFGGKSEIIAMLSIGLAVGASLPFDIGVASGGIYFFVGMGVEFSYGGGQSSLTMLLRVSIIGEVVVLGIISIGIMIALEARYGQGSLVCTGELVVKIKICWCFTLSFSQGFTVTLAGGGGGSGAENLLPNPLRPSDITDAVKLYMNSFGG